MIFSNHHEIVPQTIRGRELENRWEKSESNVLTENSVLIGLVLMVVLLSLGLADRINIMQQEKEQTRKYLVISQQRALEVQRALSESYARFVPTQFLEQLGKTSIRNVSLGDAVERDMSILFSDIRSFTEISENMSPRENFEFINEYLKVIGPAIRNQGGFIDKYIGDAVMALFPGRADDALRAARDMMTGLEEFNTARRNKAGGETSPVRIGIGIHTGHLMLGTIGEAERMDGTVIADAVNLASRLEGLTKSYEHKIIFSQDTLRVLESPDEFEFQELGEVEIKGRSEPVSIYGLEN